MIPVGKNMLSGRFYKIFKKHFMCKEFCGASKNKSSLRKYDKYDI